MTLSTERPSATGNQQDSSRFDVVAEVEGLPNTYEFAARQTNQQNFGHEIMNRMTGRRTIPKELQHPDNSHIMLGDR